MSTLQSERQRLVLRESEQRWLEAIHIVTVFAPVRVWRPRELPSVGIFVTIQAHPVLRVIVRLPARRRVAFGACDQGMLACERISRRTVIRLGERGWPPSGICVTHTAVTAVRPVDKLSLVLILMAIHALAMRNGGLEIRIFVTLQARHTLVLCNQRKLRPAVVEDAGRLNAPPRTRGVT